MVEYTKNLSEYQRQLEESTKIRVQKRIHFIIQFNYHNTHLGAGPVSDLPVTTIKCPLYKPTPTVITKP